MDISVVKENYDIRTLLGLVFSFVFLSLFLGDLPFIVLFKSNPLPSLLFSVIFLAFIAIVAALIEERELKMSEEFFKISLTYFKSFLFSFVLVSTLFMLLSLGIYYTGLGVPILLIELLVLLVFPFYFFLHLFYTRDRGKSLSRDRILKVGTVASLCLFLIVAGFTIYKKKGIIEESNKDFLEGLQKFQSDYESRTFVSGSQKDHFNDLKVYKDLEANTEQIISASEGLEERIKEGAQLDYSSLMVDKNSHYLIGNIRRSMRLFDNASILSRSLFTFNRSQTRLSALKDNYSEAEYRDLLCNNVSRWERELAEIYSERSDILEDPNQDFDTEVMSRAPLGVGLISDRSWDPDTGLGGYFQKLSQADYSWLSLSADILLLSSTFGRDLKQVSEKVRATYATNMRFPQLSRELWKKRSEDESLESKYIRYKILKEIWS